MEGDGMVAVVRGLREAGLAVTLLDGNRQYTLLPNSTTQPASSQLTTPLTNVNAATQQCPPKFTADTSTEPAAQRCDRDAQAVDGRYTSTYKSMHCNVRPTSPPVLLTEFPPQRPDPYPGHGNFVVGGTGSGAKSDIRPSSPTNSFRGGMSWPDRGSVCSPRPSRVEDAFAKSLRKYPNCLSPDRSSEVMERIVNYTQSKKGVSRSFRNSPLPTRIPDPTSQNVLEPKATFTRSSRCRTYEPDVTIHPKKTEDPPTRDRKKEEHHDRPGRGYDARCVRDISKRVREGVNAYTSYPYNHPVCPSTIIETHDYQPCDFQNSSNSVNMEIQAAVEMLSKEVATVPRADVTRKPVAVPEASIPTTGENYVEGEFYFVENLDITTSIKSIQTNVYPSDTTLKPRISAQTVFSTIDFHSSRNRTIVSRKTKSQEEIKLTKDELKISLLELINEISDNVSKNTIRDELIKKLFVTDNSERNDHKCEKKSKHDKCQKYKSNFCQPVYDYVGDYHELLGKLKHCFEDSKQVFRSEVKPFRLSEYRQLDFILKDWVNQLNLKTSDRGRYIDRSELLHTVEDRIKELLKNWTKEDFDLKTEIVEILEEIPIEVNNSYSMKSYLRKLVDMLLKRMRNVIVTQQSGRTRKKSFASRSRKILTEEDMRDFVRAHLLDFFNECNSRIRGDTLEDLENELVDLMMDSLDCIWCGHDDAIIDEMNIIIQDIGKVSAKQANYLSNTMLQEMLKNCAYNQTYTVLNVSNNTGPFMNTTNKTDFSIGSVNEDDLQSNLDRYTNQLCIQINQWLDTLDIPRIQDSGFREVVVNDLAGDIVDRHKYVELNHTGKETVQDQLEALKYQIFKWINKLVGDDNQETISHADDLLQRINSIPVPMLVNHQLRNGGPCCEVENYICPNAGHGSPKPYSQTAQGLNQSGQCCGQRICPNSLRGHGINQPCCEVDICPDESSSKPQGIQGHPGLLPHIDQSGRGSYGQDTQTANVYRPHQGQSTPNNRSGSGRSFSPVSPDNLWGSNTFSTGIEPSLAGNLSQARNGNATAGRMGTTGRTFGAMDPNQQSNDGCCHSSSPNRPGGSVPVKKLNEDYDEYLKQWVKRIPIADVTATEKQVAETARLGVYNGIWKGVTKMKLDPNIFAHQYYCQDVLEEEIERLLKKMPQSPELEEAKPTLKAQLIQKTLDMNDLIKSTNAPASFKQQLIDSIENNLPKRTLTKNKTEKENDELEKQNLADYYILYTRYKVEDSVKATVHKKNFLKKLDEFLNKIKNRHNIVDMDTTAYANEIINSFEKIPTLDIPAIEDEAVDILIAMEVENWICDIPLKPDTSGTSEKRRARDAIVKKIHDIGADVSCCDNAFRIPLQAELPKYLEKLPLQEGTNVEYLVEELANRIKNLAISSMRRESFQEPQNYEEFARNMPAASSLLEMSDDRSSFMVVGGNIVKDTGPRRPRWVREQTPVPEEDIEWLSLERTQMPSIMRSGSAAPQGMRFPQIYNPNEPGQMYQRPRSPQVYVPNTSGRFLGDIPRDCGPNMAWESESAAVPQKRQRLSMPESQMSPNMPNRTRRSEGMHSQAYNPNESLTASSCPGEGNFVTGASPGMNWVSNQAPAPQEEIQWFSLKATQMPSQMRSRSVSPNSMRSQVYCPNASEQIATQRSYPNAQQVHGQFSPNAQASFVPNSEAPFSRNVQGPFTSFNQSQPATGQNQLLSNLQGGELCTGPPCCPNPLCNRTQGSSRSGTYTQSTPHSPGPREPFGQRSPNAQGMPCRNAQSGQTSPIPQRFTNQSFGPVFGPAPQSIQNSSDTGSHIQLQGPHAPRQSQGHHGSNFQDCPNIQGAQNCSIPNNQDQSFRSRESAYNQVAAVDQGRQPFEGPLATSLSIGLGFGPYFGQRPNNGTQMDQVGQEPCCQAFPHVPGSPQKSGPAPIFGVIAGSSQGYLDAQHDAGGQAHASVNQTSQSPGPVSAVSQMPDQAPRPFNLQKMACGGMGILGTSQVPGPSSRSIRVPVSSGASAPCCPTSGAHAIPTNQATRQPGVAMCIDNKETQPTHNKLGTDSEKEPVEDPKTNQIKPLDINETEVFNYKSVQTALSSIDITTTKCKYCEVRSKSEEKLTKTTKQQEVIKKTNLGCGDLQQEVTEWFEIHSDKIKVKLWGEKMKKIVDKLKKPGGEEKLRSKIEKFLNKAPDKHPEGDADIFEFRKQLPNDIIRKLKKMYMGPKETNLSIYRMELPTYCSRFMVDNFRKAVLNWTKSLNIKKKDFLGRNVKKDDVFKYVADKLEPLVLDRPRSDSEYKIALQSNISEIVYELPLALTTNNKDFYLNKVTESLVDKLVSIENKFSSTYIQPTTKEIKEFVKDEITFFLEKCRVAISTKKMEYLETELVEILLDLTDIADIDSNVADVVTKLLKEVAKLPEYKAKYFTNLLLKEYKEFFFRENFFKLKGNSDRGRPDVYSAFQNATGLVDFNTPTSFERYRQRLVEEINKWISKLNVPVNDKNIMEVVVKDLASDIIDRYKYLLINPSLTETDAEELEQLKFQIFKWTNKWVGDRNTTVIEHAQELMKEIKNIPKPNLQSNNVVQSMLPPNTDKIHSNNAKPYIDILTDQIYDRYCELPTDLHLSQDTKLNKMQIKALAEDIEKGFEKKEDEVINKKVGKWSEKAFKAKLSSNNMQQLKNRISNVVNTLENKANDLKYEKNIIRAYEDIVDEWIDTIPIAPKRQEIFTNSKNEIVHSIAIKILKIKTKLKHLCTEDVENKLQEELSHWLKKLPLHIKVDNQNYRDKYATELVKNIQSYNVNDSVQNQAKLKNIDPVVNKLEKVIREWLIKLPLYKEGTPELKLHQDTMIKELANKLNELKSYEDIDEEITKHIRMLDLKQNDGNVQILASHLKLHLEKLDLIKDLCKQHEEENTFLVDTIEVWLKGLPLNVTDVSRFSKQKSDFIKTVKRLISSGSDNAVMKKEILIFTRTLPISNAKRYDFKYLNEEVLKLVQSLKIPIRDERRQATTKSRAIISDAIKQWTWTLPLKPVHCSRELRSFVDDMSSVIIPLLFNQEHNWTGQKDARLHREISKFLRRFPLIYEQGTESHIFRLAGKLSKTLKNISLYPNEDQTVLNNVSVYGVSLENKVGNTTADYSIQSIKESDINENLEAYMKQLIHQIGEWFDRLNLPESHQEGFKQVVINDLAGDIVDRYKYLELNPNNRGTEKDELEHLKYQIFKWINKLVGEENHETIAHAEELKQMINRIPVPMLVRTQDKVESRPISPQQRSQRHTFVGQPSLSQPVKSPIRKLGDPDVSNRGSPSAQKADSNHMSSPNDRRKPCCSQAPPPAPTPPEDGTREAMYEKYVKIFKDLCNAIPIDESTPGNAVLAQQARQAIYNAILKTFFNLKSDPKIENDYRYFEFILEETIDELVDVLPQTEELKKMRYSWKTQVLEQAINMLEDLHKLSDKPCFRQIVKDKFNRQFAIDNELQYCFVLQQGFLSSVADAYILETNYKEKDPVKASIYKNRLMKEIDKLVNHMVKEHNVGFRFFDKSRLARITIKTLEKVPIPKDDILQDEVEEIHLRDEIEKWYKELPSQPLEDEMDGVVRKRMIDLLAKKLHAMHKLLSDEDPSKEEKMKHEMSQFLEKKGKLQQDEDLNINFMVDELHHRLKNRWLHVQEPGGFAEFKKAKPLSSTLTHVDNADFLAPLIDAAGPGSTGQRKLGDQGYFIQPSHAMQTMGQVRTSYGGAPYSVQISGVPGSPHKALIHSMEPNFPRQVPYGTGMSPGRPNEGYVSQQGYLIGPNQQSPMRQNLSQRVERPRQATINTSPTNGCGTSCTSQIGTQRVQNMNQSLRQVGRAGQIGPQDLLINQNMPQTQGSVRSGGPQGQLFVAPRNQGRFLQGHSYCEGSGNIGSRGPTPSQRAGTTAQAATGSRGGPVSSEENMPDEGFRVKCRCLEAYRRMRALNYEDQYYRFRHNRCNF